MSFEEIPNFETNNDSPSLKLNPEEIANEKIKEPKCTVELNPKMPEKSSYKFSRLITFRP